jgi:hypothetical protein
MPRRKARPLCLALTMFFSFTPSLLVVPTNIMSSKPGVCFRLPTQPKTKCRKRIVATSKAPQDYADKIDALWSDFLKFASQVKEIEKSPGGVIPSAYITKYSELKTKLDTIIKDLQFLAKSFPSYFKPDYLLMIKGES